MQSITNIIAVFCVLFLTTNIFAQQAVFIIKQIPTRAVLFATEGEYETPIDSFSTKNDSLKFSTRNLPVGIYKLQFSQNHFIKFIADGKNLEIHADYDSLDKSLKIINSSSNKLYYKFLKKTRSYKKKAELLKLVLKNYPDKDDYYRTTIRKFDEISKEYFEFTDSTAQANPSSFAARYIRSAKPLAINWNLPDTLERKYLKAHALDNVDFGDEDLLRSDLFAKKTIKYLSYYMPSRSQAKEFEKAVDTLLNKARTNKAVYEYIAGYLVKGFSDYGFDLLVDRIVENYFVKDNLNIRQKLKKSLRKRIDQAKYLGRGMKAPNIVLPDTAGKVVDLSEIKAERTLVLFYASWCPHCRKNLPILVRLYNAQKKKKIEVVAVSIDTVKTEWINTIKKYKMNFTNLSDLKGWEGKAARDYFIYATPTMFLLDRNMYVVSKPQTIDEVKKIFRNIALGP